MVYGRFKYSSIVNVDSPLVNCPITMEITMFSG